MRVLATIATTLAQYRQFNAILRELDAYSDRELNDIGIGRGDLARLAWAEAERRLALPDEAPRSVPKIAARSLELAVAGQEH